MLEVKHLKRVYKVKNSEDVYALNDVSLKFPKTGLVFILGKSGSGKSTLLNVMGGLDKVDDGEIIINGKSSKQFSGSEMDSYRNTYLGFIFQEYNILNDFSVKENIALALKLQHKKPTDEEIERILEEVDLKGYGKRKPNELSGGQKQRVAIARALVKEPKIIFGDEPTGALDSNTGKQVFETLKKLSKDKLVVIVSHDRDFAEHFGDRVIELKDGKVISDISKTTVTSEKTKTGLSIIGENVIKIDKDHPLTAADLPIINAALAKAGTEAYITADNHVNDAICEAARIDKSGNREEFISTNNEKIDTGNEPFKVIKSNFTLGNAFKMGSKSLRVKPFRLGITILLSAASFTLFGSAITLGMFGASEAATSTVQNKGITEIVVNKTVKQDYSNYNEKLQYFSDEDINEIVEKGHVNAFALGNINANLLPSFRTDAYHIKSVESSITVKNAEDLSKLKIDLVAGELPKDSTECLITLYEFNTYKDIGFKYGKKTYAANQCTYEDVIGTSIEYWGYSGQVNLKIVGIVDTKLDAKYEALRTATDSNIDETLSKEFSNYMSSANKHNIIYVGEEKAAQTEDKSLETYITVNKDDTNDAKQLDTINKVAYYPSHNDKVIFFDGYTSIGDKQIVVSPSTYNNLTTSDSSNEKTYDKYIFTGIKRYFDATEDFATDDNSNRSTIEYIISEAALYKTVWDKYIDFYTNHFDEFKAFNESNENYDKVAVKSVTWDPVQQKDVYEYDDNLYASLEDSQKWNLLYIYLNQKYQSWIPKIGLYYEDLLNNYWTLKATFDETHPYTFSEINSCENYVATVAAKEYVYKNYKSFLEKYADDEDVIKQLENATTEDEKLQAVYNLVGYQIANKNNAYKYVDFIDEGIDFVNTKTAPMYENIDTTGLETKQVYLVFKNYVNWDKETGDQLPSVFDGYYTVVGIDSSLEYSEASFNKANFEAIQAVEEEKNAYKYGTRNLLLVFSDNKENISKFFDYYYEKASVLDDYANAPVGAWEISASEANIMLVDMLASLLTTMSQVFLYVGIGLAVFSIFLFYNFMSISINNKKREIGILRAVGAKRSDVFKIFFSESFIIAVINFALATVATIVLSIILNDRLATSVGLAFTIMNVGPLTIGLIAGVSLVTSILAALLPVTKIANKRPIDAIQNR